MLKKEKTGDTMRWIIVRNKESLPNFVILFIDSKNISDRWITVRKISCIVMSAHTEQK